MRTTTRRLTEALLGIVAVTAVAAGSATATGLVTGKQIKNDSVHGRDVRNLSLTSQDLGVLSAEEIAPGAGAPVGDPGAPGAPGTTGAPGASGVSDLRYFTETARPVAPGQFVEIDVNCPGQHRAVHGGISTDDDISHTRVQESAPNNSGTSWHLRVTNDGTAPVYLRGWVVCAAIGPALIADGTAR